MAVIVFLVYVAIALVLGLMAKGVGRSFWVWFVLGCVITPVMAFLLFFIVAKNK